MIRFRVTALVWVAAAVLVLAGCVASEQVTVTDSQASATPTPEQPTGPVAPIGETACRYLGVDDFGDMQIELQFTNPLPQQADAVVFYAVRDADDAVLIASERLIEDLSPNEAIRIATDTVTEPPVDDSNVTCTVGDVLSKDVGQVAPYRADSNASCRFIEIDAAGDIQVAFEFVNPVEEGTAIAVDYALRGPNGVRFQDGVTYFESVTVGDVIVEREDTLTGFPEWVTEADFSCEIVAIQRF